MKKTLIKIIDKVALVHAYVDLMTLKATFPSADARYVGAEAQKRLSLLLHDHRQGLRNKWDRTREKQKGKLKTEWEKCVLAHGDCLSEAEKILNREE